MPSLFRFLFVVTALSAIASGTMYVLATRFEPEQREEVKSIPQLKIRKE
jgi:uncharacterized protein YdgA (DUF945 family)